DALEVDQVGGDGEHVAEQFAAAAFGRDRDRDLMGLNLQAEQVDVERVQVAGEQGRPGGRGRAEEVADNAAGHLRGGGRQPAGGAPPAPGPGMRPALPSAFRSVAATWTPPLKPES